MNTTDEIYQYLFKTANHILEQSNLFTISELAQHNDPTYEEVAKIANYLAGIISQFAEDAGDWSSERIALNARQAALHIAEMASAISERNIENLNLARNRLDQLTFI